MSSAYSEAQLSGKPGDSCAVHAQSNHGPLESLKTAANTFWVCSSAAEQLTADQQVRGSIPRAPSDEP
jgi:hypothetical protein